MMKCPHCESVDITIHTIDCPKCEARIRCPECGSLLIFVDTDYNLVECPACDFKMPHAFGMGEAGMESLECDPPPPRPKTPSFPAEITSDWEKDRWEAANRLLFPEEEDRAFMLHVVRKGDMDYFSSKSPDFGEADLRDLLATLTIRKRD